MMLTSFREFENTHGAKHCHRAQSARGDTPRHCWRVERAQHPSIYIYICVCVCVKHIYIYIIYYTSVCIHTTQAHLNRVRAHETGVGSGFGGGGLSDEGTKYVGLGLKAK